MRTQTAVIVKVEHQKQEPAKILDLRKLVLEKALRQSLLLKGRDYPVVAL
ncbi:MAG: hypothetical protein WC838_04395 [Candidatus Margulisiibacteriota bacterium]|jgi:hypothetical protein